MNATADPSRPTHKSSTLDVPLQTVDSNESAVLRCPPKHHAATPPYPHHDRTMDRTRQALMSPETFRLIVVILLACILAVKVVRG